MTRIIDLPFTYVVHGIPRGARIARPVHVMEIASFEIGPDLVAEEVGHCLGHDIPFHGGRPWLAVPGIDQEGIRDPAALRNRIHAMWNRDEAQSKGFSSEFSDHAFQATASTRPWSSHFQQVVADRTWLEERASLASRFKSVEWSGRRTAVEDMTRVASHLRFVDGMLRTDRMEILQAIDGIEDVERDERRFAYDRLTGIRHEIWSSDPVPFLAMGVDVGVLPYEPFREGPGFEDASIDYCVAAGLATRAAIMLPLAVGQLERFPDALRAYHELQAIREATQAGPTPDYQIDDLRTALRTIRSPLEELAAAGPRPDLRSRIDDGIATIDEIEATIHRPDGAYDADLVAIRDFAP